MIDLSFETLRPLGLTPEIAAPAPRLQPSATRLSLARVTECSATASPCTTATPNRPRAGCPGCSQQLQSEATQLTIGDWVSLQLDAHAQAWVVERARLSPSSPAAPTTGGASRSPAMSTWPCL